jgi:hypothetical protein
MMSDTITESTETYIRGSWPVVHVPTKNVSYWLPHIRSHIEAAMRHATPPYDIEALVLSGEAGLFCPMDDEGFPSGALIAQEQVRDGQKVLHVLVVAGGNKPSWDDFWPRLVELAQSLNCAAIEGAGRKGFMRWGSDYGLRPIYTVYRVEV